MSTEIVFVPVNVLPAVITACRSGVAPAAATHAPSALRKFVVPPPERGVRPASVAVKRGKVTSVPVLLESSLVASV